MHPTMKKEMAGSPITANRRNQTLRKVDTCGGYTLAARDQRSHGRNDR